MKITFQELNRFPTSAGVYLMIDKDHQVIYVGKALNLRQRVKQYFSGQDEREMVPFLVSEIENIDFIVVLSEKEALLLENNLIKKHQPKYNALLKDNRTYFSLMINHKHHWPMVRIVRFRGRPPKGALYFGPYTKAFAARQTLELLRSLFPLRQCSDSELIRRTRPCILYDLKRCVAPCVAKCTKQEYDSLVNKTIDVLRGHSRHLINELKKEMEEASEKLEFEKAHLLLLKIRNLEETLEKQHVEKAGLKDLDALGLYRHGPDVIISQMLFREGKLTAAQEYHFPHNAQEDDELLSSFLLQEYEDQELLPDEILLPFELKEQKTLSSLLNVMILAPQKGDKKALLEMAYKNAVAHFERTKEKSDRIEKILVSLEEECALLNFPEKIECIDTSNISGSEMVSSVVVFIHGEKSSSDYRKYKIKIADPSDDYGALKEILMRRYSRAEEEDNLPDLLVIDGGKNHLTTALKVLSSLDVSTVDVIAISKDKGKHTKGVTEEKIHREHGEEPLILPPHSALLHFLQKVRDEAHRTALLFQKQRRKKRTLSSAFDDIPGIGPIKKKRLLQYFKGIEEIRNAPDEDLLKVPGIHKKDVESIKKYFLKYGVNEITQED